MVQIKKGLKVILPTLKEKKRYVVFEIISKKPMTDYKTISAQIMSKSQEFLGVLGMAKAGIQLIPKFNKKSQRGLLRVNHNYVDEVKSALAFVEDIQQIPVTIHTVGVSGILKKAEDNYLR